MVPKNLNKAAKSNICACARYQKSFLWLLPWKRGEEKRNVVKNVVTLPEEDFLRNTRKYSFSLGVFKGN